MFKRILLILPIIIAILIASYVAHDYYYYGSFFSDYKIHKEFEKLDNYPYMRWGDITSGKLLKFLQRQDELGNVDDINSNVDPFDEFTFLNEYLYNERGINYPSPKTNGEYTLDDSREHLPYKFVAAFKTGVGRKKYLILIQRVKNNDGNDVFIPLVTNKESLLINNEPSDYYGYLLNPKLNNFPSPVLTVKDSNACIKVYPNFDAYCKWYSRNAKAQNVSKLILNTINEKSIFTSDIQNTPYLIKLVVLN